MIKNKAARLVTKYNNHLNKAFYYGLKLVCRIELFSLCIVRKKYWPVFLYSGLLQIILHFDSLYFPKLHISYHT